MGSSFRLPLLVALAAHVGLLWGVGMVRPPARDAETGASVIAVALLEEDEGAQPPAAQRLSEERPVRTPREAATAPSRLRGAPLEVARAPAPAARPEPQPRARMGTAAAHRAPAPMALPGRSAAATALPSLSVRHPTIEERVSAPASLSQGEREKSQGEREEGQAERAEGPRGGFTPAALLSRPTGIYPRYCRIHGQEGTVVLDVEITADGKPGAATIVTSSGHTRLDKAAAAALRKSTFAPARRGGRPVASVRRFEWVWRLIDAEGDEQGGEE